MAMKQLIQLLETLQTTKKTPNSVNLQGVIIRGRIALKGNHGVYCKKIIILLLEQAVIRNTLPGNADHILGKTAIHRIAMGQTTVPNPNQRAGISPIYPTDNTAQKQGIPAWITAQPGTGPAQACLLKSSKQDIIFKDKDGFSACCQSFFHTEEVGFINSLLRVAWMFLYEDKLNPVQQPDPGKLLPGSMPPILPLINGDTVNFIEKIPAISVFHGCLSKQKC